MQWSLHYEIYEFKHKIDQTVFRISLYRSHSPACIHMNDILCHESKIAKSLSAECRLLLLDWLREPHLHFSNRQKLKGQSNAVAAADIDLKWNVLGRTGRKHISLLEAAGLVTVERLNQVDWVTRNDEGIAAARSAGHTYVR